MDNKYREELKKAKEKNDNELATIKFIMIEIDEAKKRYLNRVYELIDANKRIAECDLMRQNSEITS